MVSTELLRKHSVFRGASEESLRRLAMVTEEQTFERGEGLFTDGEPADRLYIVTRGEVDIRYTLNDGQQKTVDTLVAGDLLCWSAVVEPFRMTANGVARRTTRVLVIESQTLRELCESDVALGYGVMLEVAKVMSHRLHGARVRVATH